MYQDQSDSDLSAAGRQSQMLKGLTDLALLSLLADGACYGLEILERLRREAGLRLAAGALYPLLHRLEKAGWTVAEWRIEEGTVRPRKYYAITPSGRAELHEQRAAWLRLSDRFTDFLLRSVPDA